MDSNLTLPSPSNFSAANFSVDEAADAFVLDEVDEAEMQTRRTIKLVFCVVYAVLFVLGTLGNGLVIVMICNVLSTMARRTKSGSVRKPLMANAEHVFIYVLGLSIVDLFVILHLPLLIFEMREGQWPFGELTCKLYWFGESVNKLLSSFLMTVLSWDRYMAVCSPIKSMRMRTNSVAITVLFSCSLFATLLLYPVLKESTVLRVNKLTGLRMVAEEEATEQEALLSSVSDDASYNADLLLLGQQQQQIVLKCVFDTNSPFFMLYTFSVGFVVPALLITFFYVQVIRKLRANALAVHKQLDCNHNSSHGQSSLSAIRFHKVTKRIVAVILFYFFCWTPYWTLNIMSQFGIIIVTWSTLTLSSVFFAAHLLVCFNSAANPVLYALINRELRQQNAQAFQKRRRSLHLATNNALGFIEKQLPCASPSKKEHRVASVGCSDDAHLRLLGNELGRGSRSGSEDTGLDKLRSISFSHSTPALFATLDNSIAVNDGDEHRAAIAERLCQFRSAKFVRPKRDKKRQQQQKGSEQNNNTCASNANSGDAFL